MRHPLSILILLVNALPALAIPYSNIYISGESLSNFGILRNIHSNLTLPPSTTNILARAADTGALDVARSGANNLQDMIMGRSLDVLGQPIPGVYESISDVVDGVRRLNAESGQSFFVPSVPDLALSPRVGEYGATALADSYPLNLHFNARLSAALRQLEASHADVDIMGTSNFEAAH
jgi:phospholipase/lecithinase/hemolysin